MFPAWGAEVVSSNIVGYTKVGLQSGLNLIGSQFVLVGGSVAGMNDFVVAEGQDGFDDESFDAATTLKIWVGDGYIDYGWTGEFSKNNPTLAGELGIDDESYDNKWLNDDYEVADENLQIGTGFWIKAGKEGTVLLSGEVPGDDPVTQNIVAGLNMVSYPWPMAVDLQKIQVSGQTGFDDESFDATTTIKVWAGDGYYDYGWTGNFLTESPTLAGELGVDDESYNNKWLNDDYEIETEPLEIGKGFWIKASASGTVTFSK